jgi:spermidine synthase
MSLLYLVSGFTGLLYEIVWSRVLALHLGHTTGAVSTVLAAFMGGLAAGSLVGGRFAGRLTPAQAFRAYAVLELLVAATALAMPWAVRASIPLLSAAYGDGPSISFTVIRAGVCLALVAIPATLMGATFPIAIRASRAPGGKRGPALGERSESKGGRLYAANTAGAALGVVFTGFALLPSLGNVRTTLVGAVLNVGAAAAAWIMARRVGAETLPHMAITSSKKQKAPAGVARPGLAASVAFITGALALTCEVAWTRVFAMIIGPTTYAFSTMLAAFISGIALGAWAGDAISRRGSPSAEGFSPPSALAWSLIAIGLGTAGAIAAVDLVPPVVAEWTADPSASFFPVLFAQASLAALILLPTTAAFGAALPLALAAGTRADRIEADASRIYAANTAGAIAGALAAGFVLVPSVGLRITLTVVGVTAAVSAIGLFIRSGSGRPVVGLTAAAAAGLAFVALPPWNIGLMASGAYKYTVSTAGPQTFVSGESLVYYREGAAGTVTVAHTGRQLSLAIDGKVDASNGGDMVTQKLLAHLPLMIHPAPGRAAIIGLGSGVTAGAALEHPISALDVMEISPEVVEASRWFDNESGKPLSDPRTRLIVGDARTHLLLARDARPGYDVIISEPSNPWMAGVASLFTREFFQIAAARLTAGGVMCQWAHTYDISDANLRAIVATFAGVFPDTSLWLVGNADLLLIGRTAPGPDPGLAIQNGFRRHRAAADLAGIGVDRPFALTSLFAGGPTAAVAYAGDAPVETDDRLRLEFSAPRSIIGRAGDDHAARLRSGSGRGTPPPAIAAAIANASPADWRARGAMLMAARSEQAYDDYARAIEGGDDEALAGLRRSAMATGRVTDALALLRRTASDRPTPARALIELSRLQAATGQMEEAAATAREAIAADPSSPGPTRQLASVLADAGDADTLAALLPALQRLDPDGVDLRYFTAVVAFTRGDFEAAAREGYAALAIDPNHARSRNLVGAAHASRGDIAAARSAFQAAAESDPEDPSPHVNLGTLYLQKADAAAAAAEFRAALAIDPTASDAVDGLATALDLLGDAAQARRIRATNQAPSRNR